MILAAAEFTHLDWLVLIGYFVRITGFGLWISRRIHSSRGYFLGDRKLPWWVMMGQAFGTGTNAENPVAQAGATFSLGFATIWYQWKNMLITPFYWLMAPWYRRCQRTTIGEMVEDRYGARLAMVYVIFAIAFFVFNQGAMLKGAGKVISVATGGQIISPNGVVFAMTVTFILYSFFGGLVASAYTDFLQSLLIIVLSFMLIPAGLSAVGGFHGMRAALKPEFFQLYSQVSGIDAFTLVMLSLNGIVGITAQPHILTMNATGSTERAGRIGQTYGSAVKRFCTIGWALTGLIVAAMVVQRGVTLPDKEHAFGYASLELLGPGLTGLMVSCVLAANMSTCSNFMVNTGALFTKNVYKPYLNPEADDRKLLLVGRVSGLGLTLLGVLFAFVVDEVLQAFLFTETLSALIGIMIFGGILWKRANRWGAWAATLLSFVVYYGINWSQAHHLQLVYKWTPGPFGWAMLAGGAGFILVSLLTRAEDEQRVEAFFEKMRRSSDASDASGASGALALEPLGRSESRVGEPTPPVEGVANTAPATATAIAVAERAETSRLPMAADQGKDLILLDVTGFLGRQRWRGFFRRYREDLVGFVLAWAAVGLLVLMAWAIMQIGR